MALNRTDNRFILLALLVGLLSAAAGISLWQLQRAGPPASLAALVTLPEPRALADFSLADQDGNPFSLERLRGRWSLLFFGFTHCPDVCPSALYDLQQVSETLDASQSDAPPHQVVFISVDPERDTPARLSEYVRYFDPDFIGVTGSLAQLAPLAMQLGVAFHIEPHEPGSTDYSVDHSASILLTNPQGRLLGVFPLPHDADKMIRDLLVVMD